MEDIDVTKPVHHMTDREISEEILTRLRAYEQAAKTTIEQAKRNPMLSAMLGGIK